MRSLVARVKHLANTSNISKRTSCEELVGCSHEDFYEHMRKQLGSQYTGVVVPQFCRPLKMFDLGDAEQCRQAFYYTNIYGVSRAQAVLSSCKNLDTMQAVRRVRSILR